MGVVKITSVYMLMGMLILISLYMKTCSIALLLVFPNLVTYEGYPDTQGEIPLLQAIRVGEGGGGGGGERHPGRDSHTANFLGAVPEHLLNFLGWS